MEGDRAVVHLDRQQAAKHPFLGDDAAILVTESGALPAEQAEVPDTCQWKIAAHHNSPVLAG